MESVILGAALLAGIVFGQLVIVPWLRCRPWYCDGDRCRRG